MAKRAIKWPPTGNRLELTPDPSDPNVKDRAVALRQIIRLRLFDYMSGNPWNDSEELGTSDPTFSGPRGSATIRARIVQHFRELESARRARLVAGSVTIERAAGVVRVSFDYVDMETSTRENMEIARNVNST